VEPSPRAGRLRSADGPRRRDRDLGQFDPIPCKGIETTSVSRDRDLPVLCEEERPRPFARRADRDAEDAVVDKARCLAAYCTWTTVFISATFRQPIR